ncbi:MAG: ion transporter [Pseudomonadales bacterium]|nr:ion transporter [Pseudomonadales bacterium]
MKTQIVRLAKQIAESSWFLNGITTVILVNGVVIGLETVDTINEAFGFWFHLFNQVAVGIFVVEAIIKIVAHHPRMHKYFSDGWNVFDFTVVVLCLIPGSGYIPMLARVLRLLRVLSVIPSLRVLVTVLVRSLPGMLNIVALTVVIFYVYGVAGHYLFAEVDPTHWRSLGISLLSLFRIVTLEDWTDIMYAAMTAHWWAWMYFVSLVLVGTFVVFNLIIAVVISNHDRAMQDDLHEKYEKLRENLGEQSRSEALLMEIHEIREALNRLETQVGVENSSR